MPDDEDEQEEEAIKSYRDILAQKIAQGLAEIERSASGLFLSGLSAGLDIGFSVFLMAVTLTLTKDVFPHPVVRLPDRVVPTDAPAVISRSGVHFCQK